MTKMRARQGRQKSTVQLTRAFVVVGAAFAFVLFWREFSYQSAPVSVKSWKVDTVAYTKNQSTKRTPTEIANRTEVTEILFPNVIRELGASRNKAADDTELQQLSVSYRLFPLAGALDSAYDYCQSNSVACTQYSAFEKALSQYATSDGSERLHLIPVDLLNIIYDSDRELYRTNLDRLIQAVNSDRYYIRYKGSDFVFICLASSCQRLGKELGKKLAGGQGTRAIFVGTELEKDTLKWPCPLRVVKINKTVSSDITSLPEKILDIASQMIEKEKRWVCADAKHPAHYFGTHNERMSHGGIYMKEYGFVMCAIPKSGSTMMSFLLRRMMHKPDWRSRENGLPHNPSKTGLRYLGNANITTLKSVYDDPSILKGAVVRHPITRLLSGYLDKIIAKKQYQRVKNLNALVREHGIPAFSDFVDHLIRMHPNPDKLDKHFRPQSSACGFRDHRMDFVGSLSELGSEFQEFSESLGFFEEFVADGWGEDEDQQFGVKAYQPNQHFAHMKIWDHYTKKLMKKVYLYYKEDFDRFGFSIEEALATKPKPASQ